jgi:hypothetical protein
MSQVPCPKCGDLMTCAAEEIGRTVRCAKCGALLRLDAETPAPADGRTPGRVRRRRAAAVLLIFLCGAAVGFLCGRGTAPGTGSGLSVNAFGVFSAQNHVVVEDGPGAKPPADGDARPEK